MHTLADRHTARHRVLAIYCAWNALMQFEWLRFAPITEHAAAAYGVNSAQIGYLSLVFPLLFLPLALPSGQLIDRMRVRTALRCIAALMTFGAVLRASSPGFGAALAGQAIIALAQPLVMGLISRLVGVWFPADEQLRATSLATIALLAGLALAFLAIPPSAPFALSATLQIDAAMLALLALLTLLLIPGDPHAGGRAAAEPVLDGLRKLVRNPQLITLAGLIFIANGAINALLTWLEALLKPHGWSTEQAGVAGLLLLAGGVGGMALSTRIRRRIPRLRTLLALSSALAIVLASMLCLALPKLVIGLLIVILGLIVQGPLPAIIEAVANSAGPRHAGLAVSLFWLVGNAGAAAIIAALPIGAAWTGWGDASALLALLFFLQLLVTLVMPRTDDAHDPPRTERAQP